MESSAPVPRFFCYQCRVEVNTELRDFKCPHCSDGFIVQIEDDHSEYGNQSFGGIANSFNIDDSEPPETPPQPRIMRQFTDVGIDEMDEPPPPANSQDSIGNDLSFLMTSGDRVRTMRLGSPESLLQHLMWQITGGRVGGQPFLLVNSDPNDYIMSGESIDAIMSQLLWHSDNDGPPPLALEFIERLPEIEISKEQVASNLQCSVCWETYNLEEKVRQLKCGHIYHKDCIFPWLALHATCPICRQSLTPPESSEPEQRNGAPREPTNNAQNIRVPPPSIAALLLRACGNPSSLSSRNETPASTTSAPATPSSSRTVYSPASSDTITNTAVSEPSNNDATATNTTNVTSQIPNQTPTNTNQTGPRRLTATITPGINHIVLMSSAPHNFDPNNFAEYFAFWSNGAPISSTTVSSTTSDVNSRRSPANYDMDLE